METIRVFKEKETTYKYVHFMVKNTEWSLLVAEGGFNYISVRKESNNPFKSTGTDFENINEALSHYKNPAMVSALINANNKLTHFSLN